MISISTTLLLALQKYRPAFSVCCSWTSLADALFLAGARYLCIFFWTNCVRFSHVYYSSLLVVLVCLQLLWLVLRQLSCRYNSSIEKIVEPDLKVPLALVGKFGSSGSMAIMFVYTAELFPTSVRNTAIGLSSMWGRVGGMLAPQVIILINLVSLD